MLRPISRHSSPIRMRDRARAARRATTLSAIAAPTTTTTRSRRPRRPTASRPGAGRWRRRPMNAARPRPGSSSHRHTEPERDPDDDRDEDRQPVLDDGQAAPTCGSVSAERPQERRARATAAARRAATTATTASAAYTSGDGQREPEPARDGGDERGVVDGRVSARDAKSSGRRRRRSASRRASAPRASVAAAHEADRRAERPAASQPASDRRHGATTKAGSVRMPGNVVAIPRRRSDIVRPAIVSANASPTSMRAARRSGAATTRRPGWAPRPVPASAPVGAPEERCGIGRSTGDAGHDRRRSRPGRSPSRTVLAARPGGRHDGAPGTDQPGGDGPDARRWPPRSTRRVERAAGGVSMR